MQTSWIEVNLGALEHNVAQVRELAGSSVKVMAVVKANAYGHGLVETSNAFVKAGAGYLGVSTLEEGMELREAGVKSPVLVFSPMLVDQIEDAVEYALDQTVCNTEYVWKISDAAKRMRRKARVHVKVDTGMGRLGVLPEDSEMLACELLSRENIEVTGVYTHFANAADAADAARQNRKFSSVVANMALKEMEVGLRHAANSAALLSMPDARYDMVRTGTLLYGQYPAGNFERMPDLRETWRFKTRIVEIRKLEKGAKVGYGSEFTAKRQCVAAVIPIGYSDGFTLTPESVLRRRSSVVRTVAGMALGANSGPKVRVKGVQVPVIGRVGMQMCSLDVTDVPGIELGDEVLVPVRRTSASSRVKRVYLQSF